MGAGKLGKMLEDGEIIFRQGDVGDSMYVIQEGQVEVFVERQGTEVRLRLLGEGETVGEMAIFARETRSASVRALGRVRVLTLDKKTFLTRVQQDPSLAFRILETMSRRIRELSDEVVRLRSEN
jgi:CRP-like cAMP-binding protein